MNSVLVQKPVGMIDVCRKACNIAVNPIYKLLHTASLPNYLQQLSIWRCPSHQTECLWVISNHTCKNY